MAKRERNRQRVQSRRIGSEKSDETSVGYTESHASKFLIKTKLISQISLSNPQNKTISESKIRQFPHY